MCKSQIISFPPPSKQSRLSKVRQANQHITAFCDKPQNKRIAHTQQKQKPYKKILKQIFPIPSMPLKNIMWSNDTVLPSHVLSRPQVKSLNALNGKTTAHAVHFCIIHNFGTNGRPALICQERMAVIQIFLKTGERERESERGESALVSFVTCEFLQCHKYFITSTAMLIFKPYKASEL